MTNQPSGAAWIDKLKKHYFAETIEGMYVVPPYPNRLFEVFVKLADVLAAWPHPQEQDVIVKMIERL